MRTFDAQSRNTPCVDLFRVDRDSVLLARQHLAPRAEPERDLARVLSHQLLEFRAEARRLCGVRERIVLLAAALHPVTADEVRMFIPDVAESGDINPVRAPVRIIVFHPFQHGYEATRGD